MDGFEIRGVIEGYYGPPWTTAERFDLLHFLGTHGFNTYIYAPKSDPLHREAWREPYSAAALEEFQSLIGEAQAAGVDFVFAISPGLSLKYADGSEMDLLWQKIATFAEMGVRTFGLFLDDIPADLVHAIDREHYSGLAAAQADFLGRLHGRMIAADPP